MEWYKILLCLLYTITCNMYCKLTLFECSMTQHTRQTPVAAFAFMKITVQNMFNIVHDYQMTPCF